MNLKKIKILGVFSIFGLCFLLHFIYNWIPNSILAIFVPVNESIWEHMKLIPTSFILWGIIDFILLKKYENFNNFLLQLFIVPVIGIILYLLIYLPLYNIFGENMIISIVLLFIVIGPENDIELLRRGITVDDDYSLAKTLEDFGL